MRRLPVGGMITSIGMTHLCRPSHVSCVEGPDIRKNIVHMHMSWGFNKG